MNMLLAALLLLTATSAFAADTIRVCTYNVLRFTADNEDGRVPMYRAILNEIRPDVLMCVEVADATMGPRFVTDVLTWAPFAATPYISGPDMNAQLFYDQQKFDLVGQRRIPTVLRDIAEFTLTTRPTNGINKDTLVLYALHLKASDSPSDAAQRAQEVQAMMTSMTTARYAVIGGDLNVYAPNEQAYQQIVGPSAVRRFVDPLGTIWQRNSTSFAGMYTQCTRATNIAGCGGGVTGGMDDRFDYLFVSEALEPRTILASYTAYGNDGQNRLNAAINVPANTIVSAGIADALLCASDHLPVYMDVVLGDVQASVRERMVSPTVTLKGRTLTVSNATPGDTIAIYDLVGSEVYRTAATTTSLQIDVRGLPKGLYLVQHAGVGRRVAILR